MRGPAGDVGGGAAGAGVLAAGWFCGAGAGLLQPATIAAASAHVTAPPRQPRLPHSRAIDDVDIMGPFTSCRISHAPPISGPSARPFPNHVPDERGAIDAAVFRIRLGPA